MAPGSFMEIGSDVVQDGGSSNPPDMTAVIIGCVLVSVGLILSVVGYLIKRGRAKEQSREEDIVNAAVSREIRRNVRESTRIWHGKENPGRIPARTRGSNPAIDPYWYCP